MIPPLVLDVLPHHKVRVHVYKCYAPYFNQRYETEYWFKLSVSYSSHLLTLVRMRSEGYCTWFGGGGDFRKGKY